MSAIASATRRVAKKWTTALLAVIVALILATSTLLAGCACTRQPDPEPAAAASSAAEPETAKIAANVMVFEADGIQYRHAVDDNGDAVGEVFTPVGSLRRNGATYKVSKELRLEEVGPSDPTASLTKYAAADKAATLAEPATNMLASLANWFAPTKAYAAETSPNPGIEERERFGLWTDTRAAALEVFALTNTERAKEGLPALVWDDGLWLMAQVRANEITTSFSHFGEDGTRVIRKMVTEWGLQDDGIAENIAGGQDTPVEAVASWMNSPGHRRTLMGNAEGYFAAGVAFDTNGIPYWVQVFYAYWPTLRTAPPSEQPGFKPPAPAATDEPAQTPEQTPDPAPDTAAPDATEPAPDDGLAGGLPDATEPAPEVVTGVPGDIVTDPLTTFDPDTPIDVTDLVTVTPDPDDEGKVEVELPINVDADVPVVIGNDGNGGSVVIRPTDPDGNPVGDGSGYVYVPGIPGGEDLGPFIPQLPDSISDGSGDDTPIVGVEPSALDALLAEITAKRDAGDYDGADRLADLFLNFIKDIPALADAASAVEAAKADTAAARAEADRLAAEQAAANNQQGGNSQPPSNNGGSGNNNTPNPPAPPTYAEPGSIPIPDVIGWPGDQAREYLRQWYRSTFPPRTWWEMVLTFNQYHPTAPVGTVFATEWVDGVVVLIRISDGPSPT